MLEVIKDGGEAVGLRLDGQEFFAEDETGQVIIPKALLKDFRLSDIPERLLIKPVNSIEGNVIELEHDILIGPFRDGLASAEVEDMGRRKLWDGEIGFPKFMDAMRQAIREVCWLDGVVGMRPRSSQELYVVASKKEKNFWLEGLDSIPPDSATLSVDGR